MYELGREVLRNRTQLSACLPACLPSRCFLFRLIFTTNPHVLTTALQLVFEMRRGKDWPPINIRFRSSAMDHVVSRRPRTTEARVRSRTTLRWDTFCPVTVIPSIPQTHLRLTTAPIRSRKQAGPGKVRNSVSTKDDSTSTFFIFRTVKAGYLLEIQGRICRPRHVSMTDAAHTLPHDMLFLVKPAAAPSGNGIKTIIAALIHGICIYDVHRQPFNWSLRIYYNPKRNTLRTWKFNFIDGFSKEGRCGADTPLPLAWFLTSAAKYVRSALFWVITQRVSYQRGSHFYPLNAS
jgi:hypothetical protein